MRVHGDMPAAPHWSVYHAPSCKVLENVLWADDESARWCALVMPLELDPSTLHPRTVEHQARRIEIALDARCVIIDPIDDVAPDMADIEQLVDAPAAP